MNNVTRANALAMVAGDVLLAVSDLVHGLPFVRFDLMSRLLHMGVTID
jgi:hypothetical protein